MPISLRAARLLHVPVRALPARALQRRSQRPCRGPAACRPDAVVTPRSATFDHDETAKAGKMTTLAVDTKTGTMATDHARQPDGHREIET